MPEKTAADYRREAEAQELKHAELLATLEIPTYTHRTLNAQWVKSKDETSITGTTGWTAGAPAEVLHRLHAGDPYILETRGFSLITGWLIDGTWYARKSDQDLDRQHTAFVEASRRRSEEYAAAHRDEWAEREAKLPEWIAARLRDFHSKPEFETEPMGWGYELIVCELAVMYAAIGPEILDKTASTVVDSAEISAFADKHGTSGAQHAFALTLAKHHLNQKQAKGTNLHDQLHGLT